VHLQQRRQRRSRGRGGGRRHGGDHRAACRITENAGFGIVAAETDGIIVIRRSNLGGNTDGPLDLVDVDER